MVLNKEEDRTLSQLLCAIDHVLISLFLDFYVQLIMSLFHYFFNLYVQLIMSLFKYFLDFYLQLIMSVFHFFGTFMCNWSCPYFTIFLTWPRSHGSIQLVQSLAKIALKLWLIARVTNEQTVDDGQTNKVQWTLDIHGSLRF